MPPFNIKFQMAMTGARFASKRENTHRRLGRPAAETPGPSHPTALLPWASRMSAQTPLSSWQEGNPPASSPLQARQVG